jgi:VCBS repeat protein/FG-GAP repeat protein
MPARRLARLLPPLGLSALLMARTAAGQTAAPGNFFRAMGLMRTGDTAGAITMMRAVSDRDTTAMRPLRQLATMELQARRYDASLQDYRVALRRDTTMGRALAMYGIGDVYAAMGNRDSAFAWLGRAAAMHKADMTAMETDPALDSLRHDPRYKTLLPTAKDFAHPFVEPVRIIREFDGESSNDQFGWIARNIGDVDHDGVADFVTSAPSSSAAGAAAGRIYVYSSRTATLLWQRDGKAGDQLGLGIEGAGDLNRDGIPDVIASAPGASMAYALSGNDGRVLFTMTGPDTHEAFGTHVDGAGDVDGDGYGDVIIGSPDPRPKGGPGHAYVYSGRDGHLLMTLTGERDGDAFGSAVSGGAGAHGAMLVVGAPSGGPNGTGRTYVYDGMENTPRFVTESDSTGSALGAMFLSLPGDMDGDGTPDVYSSDYSNSAHGLSTGRVYVHSGATGKLLLTLTGEGAGEAFGTSPSMAGDVDHDGRADLIVGAWQYAGAALSGGRAYLYSGRDGKLLGTFTDQTPGDTFGFDAVGLGDVDGDGITDLLITAAWSGVHGFHSGRVFIVSSGVRKK